MAGIGHSGGRTRGVVGVALLAAACLLAGCKVLTIEEDRAIRARRGGDLDPAAYVAGLWGTRALPTLNAAAVPVDTLAPLLGTDLDRAGAAHGRRAGDGSPWTFVVKGTGRVVSVDPALRRGRVMVAVAGWPGGQAAEFQIGPVVAGSAIRDALPFVAFDDFADQLAFADVGRALTTRALAGVRPAALRLRTGETVRFVGVVNVRDAGAPLVVTPIALAADRAG